MKIFIVAVVAALIVAAPVYACGERPVFSGHINGCLITIMQDGPTLFGAGCRLD